MRIYNLVRIDSEDNWCCVDSFMTKDEAYEYAKHELDLDKGQLKMLQTTYETFWIMDDGGEMILRLTTSELHESYKPKKGNRVELTNENTGGGCWAWFGRIDDHVIQINNMDETEGSLLGQEVNFSIYDQAGEKQLLWMHVHNYDPRKVKQYYKQCLLVGEKA